ncbi:MAG TPA: class I SAM-dependent methyltransferase [Bacteroidota bacterium]|nr:class I SAM-dependent methyltransferase [Bacteroidota bacterium]
MNAPGHLEKYWQFEYDVAARYLIPLLRSWGVEPRGASVLDVGCAEGGGLCALYDAGADCRGFDVEASRVADGLRLKGDRAITMVTGDMYAPVPPFGDRRFDLVTLHDVFEHLEDKSASIAKLARYLAPGGKLLITFPPWYSAYGGHQQHLRFPLGRLPFVHLLPFGPGVILPRLRGESPSVVREIRKLGTLRMGMRKFRRIAAGEGLRILRAKAYIVSPNHMRFGLRPVGAGPVAHIPVIREFLCSGVIYLLDLP